jgi:hypothetical protein
MAQLHEPGVEITPGLRGDNPEHDPALLAGPSIQVPFFLLPQAYESEDRRTVLVLEYDLALVHHDPSPDLHHLPFLVQSHMPFGPLGPFGPMGTFWSANRQEKGIAAGKTEDQRYAAN